MVRTERALTRFRCGHCGSRLVVQTRLLDRLVACHACRRPTHPVAGRLAGTLATTARTPGKPEKAPKGAPARPKQPNCANCGDLIGKLQVTRRWREETVCEPCHAKLTSETRVQVPAVAATTIPESPVALAKTVKRTVARQAPVAPAAAEEVPVLELSVAPLAPVLLVGAACLGFFAALTVMSYLGGIIAAVLLVAGAAVGVRWLRRGTSSVRARFEQISTLRQRHGMPHVLAMLVAWFRAQPAARLPYALFLLLFWGAMYVPYRLTSLLQSPRPRSEVRLPT